MKLFLIGVAAVLGLFATTFAIFESAQPKTDPGHITFQENAIRVPLLLERLSKQTGTQLSATQDFKNEVVLVQVEDVPLEDLLERIATATSGSWHLGTDGTRRLIANTSVRREERAAYLREFEVRLKANLDKLREDRKRVEEFRDQNRSRLQTQPADKLEQWEANHDLILARFDTLLAVPGKDVLRGLQGQRIVYSTRPNASQLPMPQPVREALARAIESLALTSTVASGDQPSLRRQELRNVAEHLRTGRSFGDGATQKVLLVMQPTHRVLCPSFGPQLRLEAFLYENEETAPTPLRLSSFSTHVPNVFERQMEAPAQSSEDPLPISERSAHMIEVIVGADLKQPRREPISRDFIESMKDVVVNDPHSYQNSDALSALAQRRGKNLVASLSDIFWLYVAPAAEPSMPVSYLEREIQDHFELSEEEGWITLKPKFADIYRDHRTDREDLKWLLTTAGETPTISLSDMMTFAARNPEPRWPLLTDRWLRTFTGPSFGSRFSPESYWLQLRLMAGLSEPVRSQLLGGGSVEFGDLGEQDLMLVLNYLLRGEPALTLAETETARMRRDPAGVWQDHDWSQPRTARVEVTEVLANGLDPRGRITVETERNQAALLQDAQGELAPDEPVVNAQTYGLKLAHVDQVPHADFSRFDHIRLGSERRWLISIQPAPGIESLIVFSEFVIPRESPAIPISQLPAEFRATAMEIVERARAARWWERLPGRGPQP